MSLLMIFILIYLGQIILTIGVGYIIYRVSCDADDERTVGDFIDYISDGIGGFYWFMVFFPYLGLAFWLFFVFLGLSYIDCISIESFHHKYIENLKI